MKTKILGITSAFLFLVFLSAYSQEPCKVLKSDISGKYEGKCKKGLAHGKGVAVGKDRYEGGFSYGLPDGKGKYMWSTGEIYEGRWESGMRTGEGKYWYKKNGVDSILVGIWKDDVFVKRINPRPYQILTCRDIDRYTVRKVGEGDMVTLTMDRMGGTNPDVSEFSFVSDNGLYREESHNYIYYQLKFPVKFKINFTSMNKMRSFPIYPSLEVVINEPGVWEIKIFN